MEYNHIHFGHNHDPHDYFIYYHTPKCVPPNKGTPNRGTNIIQRVKPSRTRQIPLLQGQPNPSKAADSILRLHKRSRHNKRGAVAGTEAEPHRQARTQRAAHKDARPSQ